jgi:hypothetical protein
MVDKIQWEYHAITLGTFFSEPKDEQVEAALNQLGEEGWEVISVVAPDNTNKLRVIAKRPLTQEARRRRSWPE